MMDPNETLKTIRGLISTIQGDNPTFTTYTVLAQDLADAVQNLDEWLSKDGFLPDAWVPVSCPECRMRRTHTPDCSQR